MLLRIFTLPFDPVIESFPDEVITEFCLNKKVHKLESQFFQQEGRAYWSVSVHYEILAKGEDKTRDLDEYQKLLFERLREWRKETAHNYGVPVYLIATNQQLVEIIRRKVQTVEAMKGVKGFGRGKMERYGLQILAQVKAFYDSKQSKKEEKKDDLPFQ